MCSRPALRSLRHLSLVLAMMFSWGPTCDAATFVVTKLADTSDGVCSMADCSLREAILAANAADGLDTVSIPAGTYNLTRAGRSENAGLTGDLDVTDAVILQGAGADVTIVDAQDLDRVLDLCPTGCASGGENEVRGLTLTNGFLDSADEFSGNGVRVDVLTVRFFDSVISDHDQNPDLLIEGGGVGNENVVNVHLTRTTVTGNRAFAGAGIRSNGPLFVTDSVISNNVTDGFGGGIRAGRVLTMNRSAVIGNTGFRGSGLLIHDGLSLVNSTVSGNLGSAGIHVDSGVNAGLHNSTLVAEGVPALATTGDAHVDFANTIVSGACDPAFETTLSSLGHNLDTGDTCKLTERTDQTDTDPLLGPLTTDPAFPPVHPLLAGSPAIGTGGGGFCQTQDQRGEPRSTATGTCGNCDIGAFEVQEDVARSCTVAYVIGNGTLRAIDLDALEVLRTLVLPTPTALDASGDGSRLYVAGDLSAPSDGLIGYVAFVDTATTTVVDTVRLSFLPTAVAAHPSEPRVYVAGTDGPFDASLSEVDTETGQVLRTVELSSTACTNGGIEPLHLEVSESTDSLVASVLADAFHTGPILYALDTLVEIDCLATTTADAIAVSPGGAILYAVDEPSGDVERYAMPGTPLTTFTTDEFGLLLTNDLSVPPSGEIYAAAQYQPGLLTIVKSGILEIDPASGVTLDVLVTHLASKVAADPGARRVGYLVENRSSLFVGDLELDVIDEVLMDDSPRDLEILVIDAIVDFDPAAIFGSGFEDVTLSDWSQSFP